MAQRKSKPDALTPKRKAFADKWLITMNGTQSYMDVYKCSRESAETQAVRLLGNVKVQEYIKSKQAKIAEKLEITAEKVIAEFAKIGFSNIQDFIDSGAEIKDLATIDRNKAAAVESIQVDIRHDGGESEGYTEKVKFKLHSKVNALENLGKHLGIFERDNKQKTDMTGLADVIRLAAEAKK